MKLSRLFLYVGCVLVVACSSTETVVESSPSQTEPTQVQIPELVPEPKQAPAPIVTPPSPPPSISPKVPDAQTAVSEQDRLEQQRFEQFVERLKEKALQEGISRPVIDKAFANVTLLKRVIASDKNQLEKKVTLDDYLNRVLTARRMSQAKQMYQLNAEQLAKTEAVYKVPANYIVALWGLESNFGRLQGKENIISAMSSLAFEGRRETFFTNQLMSALKILEDGHVEIDNLKGSWAGAMGQCQFMPSSFISYGADGDGDGKIDIWTNRADVFASAANYLATEGWDPSVPWGREVTLPVGFDVALSGLEDDKAKTVSEWQSLGVKVSSTGKNEAQKPAWIVLPDDAEGRAFIAYSNFKTLMHWNRSYYFVISVGTLADSIVADELP